MKNILATFLLFIFILPAFGPWMPHSALQALHVQQERHHGVDADQHDHHGHSHDSEVNASHSVHFDVVTYFNDYLHVDLKHSDHAALSALAHDTHATDYVIVADTPPLSFSVSSHIQTTGPPDYDWRMSRPGTPIYLATQRLRI
ncbi:MAG: hypothetical protein WBK55_08530 [Alphaproteobacteria bacterium]